MKKIFFLSLFLFTVWCADAQRRKIDSLKRELEKTQIDTNRLRVLGELARALFLSKPDSSLIYGQQGYDLAIKFNHPKAKALLTNAMANAYSTMGDYPKAMQFYMQSLHIAERDKDLYAIVTVHNNIADAYMRQGEYSKALPYLNSASKQVANYSQRKLTSRQIHLNAILLLNAAECFLYTGKIDSAEIYLKQCYERYKKENVTDVMDNVKRDLGVVEVTKGNKAEAMKYFAGAIEDAKAIDDIEMISITYLSIANLYHKLKQTDSAIYYAQKALTVAHDGHYHQDALNAAQDLYTFYDANNNLPEAYKYFKIATAAKDSLYNQDKVKQLLSIDFDEKQRQRDIAAAQEQYRDKVRTYSMIAGLVVLLLLVFVFWRNSNQRQKANRLLQTQKEEIQSALSKLELTKDQLIQSEKMASLGELTAGIAHEIQNPLNFVNNFSEVSGELTAELKSELRAGNTTDAIAIADNLEQNLSKIQHHGKRADFIVKGMLQHSRTGTGEKQPTNINVLADEFLKLSYHGLRAKDKSFNSEMLTHFDLNLPKANVIPQEIGRVLLNLFNNAFYAVNQKTKTAGADYKPLVEVTTRAGSSGGKKGIEVLVKDNGIGIPEAIKDKIMQPFFTTKPTGEGTGLGLSLTYDMVVKGHGGSINVQTKEGEGSEFSLFLPLS